MEMMSLTDESNESYFNQQIYYIWKKIEDGDDDKKFCKVLDPCHFAG